MFLLSQEFHQEAQAAGATLYGGSELIKDVQNGELNLREYDYILAHPNILPELVTLRGLLKKRFPSPKSGTLGVNIAEMVNKFKNGIQYSAEADDNQNDFGLVTTSIGKVISQFPTSTFNSLLSSFPFPAFYGHKAPGGELEGGVGGH